MRVMPRDFYNRRWASSNIPVKQRGLDFRHYEPFGSHVSITRAIAAAHEFVDTFTDHYISEDRAVSGDLPDNRSTIGKGLMFYGRNGTRKTTLAIAVMTELQYQSHEYDLFYARFSDWKTWNTDMFQKDDSEVRAIAKTNLERAMNCSLLVLDDVGQEHRTTSGFTQSMLHELLRLRYDKARPTIITTNHDLDELEMSYGTSFASFMWDAFDPHVMFGKDSRKPTEN